jgi:hypothetical protein
MEVLSAYGVGRWMSELVQQAILKQDLLPGNDWVYRNTARVSQNPSAHKPRMDGWSLDRKHFSVELPSHC